MNLKKFKILDSHHHFWNLSMKKHPWLYERPLINFRYGNYEKICKNFLFHDYMKVSANYNVHKTIHMEAEWDRKDPIGEIIWLEKIHKEFGFPNGAVGQIWLHENNSELLLKEYFKHPIVRSVRQKPNYDDFKKPIVKLSDEAFRVGFSKLAKYNLHFDLQIPWKFLRDAKLLADDFPHTLIILNHAGLPYDRSIEGLKSWRSAINIISQCPNVVVKISGIGVPNSTWNKYNNEGIINYLIDKFGADRCMFGSNFPVDSLCASYDQIVETLFECISSLTKTEINNIFYSNALKFYKPL